MIPRPQRLLGEALQFSSEKHPSKTAIIIRDEEFPYAALRESAEKLASHLVNAGIKRGDRVAISMNNTWQCVVAIYGNPPA